MYSPISSGFVYLIAVMGWHSRKVLGWKLSNTMDTSFCVEVLEEAINNCGQPEIFNTDQGSQFTSGVLRGRRHKDQHGYAGSCEGFQNTVLLTLIASVDAGEEVRTFYIPRKVPSEDLKGNPAQGLNNVLVKDSTR